MQVLCESSGSWFKVLKTHPSRVFSNVKSLSVKKHNLKWKWIFAWMPTKALLRHEFTCIIKWWANMHFVLQILVKILIHQPPTFDIWNAPKSWPSCLCRGSVRELAPLNIKTHNISRKQGPAQSVTEAPMGETHFMQIIANVIVCIE